VEFNAWLLRAYRSAISPQTAKSIVRVAGQAYGS